MATISPSNHLSIIVCAALTNYSRTVISRRWLPEFEVWTAHVVRCWVSTVPSSFSAIINALYIADPFRDRMHRLADHGLRTWTNTSDANNKKSVLQVNVLLFQQLSQCVTGTPPRSENWTCCTDLNPELEKFQIRYWIRKCDIFRKFLKNSIPMCMSSEETISGLLCVPPFIY